MENPNEGKRGLLFSPGCMPWALNLWPQTLVWSQPTPEGVGVTWNRPAGVGLH